MVALIVKYSGFSLVIVLSPLATTVEFWLHILKLLEVAALFLVTIWLRYQMASHPLAIGRSSLLLSLNSGAVA